MYCCTPKALYNHMRESLFNHHQCAASTWMRDLLSQANGTIWHPRPELWARASLAAQQEPTGLPERVLNTISEAKAPSTRRLYTLKWSVFSTWCLNCGENSSTSELVVVLSFLHELLDKGHSHSTLYGCL